MKTIVKFAIWLAAAFSRLFVWNTAPDFRLVAIWGLPAAIACYALSLVVQRSHQTTHCGRIDRAPTSSGDRYGSA
jgi:hypothetical protein